MSTKGCELCNNPARMYCESDQASLCWNCDEIVHSANFLVAKHSRILLCHVCQSPTSWQASGMKIGPTVSICHLCAAGENGGCRGRSSGPQDDDQDCDALQESEDDDGEYYTDDDEDEDDDEEGADNQVVPWSSFSGSEDNVNSSSSLQKRMRENHFESPEVCSSEVRGLNTKDGGATEMASTSGESSDSFRPLKLHKEINGFNIIPPENAIDEDRTAKMKSRRADIIGSLRKFQQLREGDASAMITCLSKLSRD